MTIKSISDKDGKRTYSLSEKGNFKECTRFFEEFGRFFKRSLCNSNLKSQNLTSLFREEGSGLVKGDDNLRLSGPEADFQWLI